MLFSPTVNRCSLLLTGSDAIIPSVSLALSFVSHSLLCVCLAPALTCKPSTHYLEIMSEKRGTIERVKIQQQQKNSRGNDSFTSSNNKNHKMGVTAATQHQICARYNTWGKSNINWESAKNLWTTALHVSQPYSKVHHANRLWVSKNVVWVLTKDLLDFLLLLWLFCIYMGGYVRHFPLRIQ